MKTTTKYLSETRVKVTIICDADELKAAEQVALHKLAKTIKVPGFRTGKLPVNVAAKHIDPNKLSQETLENALSKAVADAFIAEKIQVLDRPEVEVKKFVPGSLLEFTAEAEILPKIKLGDYKKLKVKKDKVKLEKADVTELIDRMRTSMAEKKDVDRAAKDGDETVIDFVGKKDGVAFEGGTGSDYSLKLGSNSFIPGFEEGIIGHKPGEKFDLDLVFPEEYHSADLKGAKVVFETTLKAVKELVLPEVNDEFAAKVGPFKTVAEMNSDVERELTSQKERSVDEKFKDDLLGELIKVSKVPAPKILIKDQAASIEKDMTQNLMYQGLSLEQYIENKGFATKEKWIETEVRDAAEKRVQAGLVLAELSKVEKIQASNEELEEQVAKYKQQYGKNAEALKQLDTPEARRDIANRLLTEKTIDRLVELNSK